MLRLSHGGLELDLAPDLGGRVAALRFRGRDILVPLTDKAFDPDNWPKAGAYPLIPFHNRVKNATLTCGDRVAHLPEHPECIPHALHGMASRCIWQGHIEAPDVAVMSLDWPASSVWPWSFRAEQRLVLRDGGLDLHLTIENRDTVEMPAGLGWHPYIARPRDVVDDARTIWPIRSDYLPTGEQRSQRPADKLSMTRYLSDWSWVAWAVEGCQLDIRAQDLPHLVIHAAPGGDYVCIEPVSHVAGASSFLTGHAGTDLLNLPSGARMQAVISLGLTECISELEA